MSGRKLTERDESERREVGKRLIHVPDKLIQIDSVSERELELVVLGGEVVRDQARVCQLARRPRSFEADTERLDRLAHVARHHGDDKTRVQASAQHRAERHVAHQSQPNRLIELRRERRLVFVVGQAFADVRLRVLPILLLPNALGRDDENVSRHQLRDSVHRCHRPREEPERKVGVDGRKVQLCVDEPTRHHALELGSEDDGAVGLGVVERLDAEPVAREDTGVRACVPDRNTEHSSELCREHRAIPLVEVGMTSVSHLVRRTWPSRSSDRRSSRWLNSSPFCIAQISPLSLGIG